MVKNPHLPGEPDKFIEDNMNLAHHVAWKFIRAAKKDDRIKFDKDDFFSIAYIGLIKAYNKFDPTQHEGLGEQIKFSTYAIPMIRGEIWRYTRDTAYTIRQRRGHEAIEMDYLDRPLHEDNKRTLGEVVGGITTVDEEQVVTNDFLDKLSPRLQLVHKLRALDISQAKVGEVLGLTQISVSKMERYLYESARQYGQGESLENRVKYRTEGYKKKAV